MKRNEIVEKLIKEGFSEKTLVKFTDKQLSDLSSRIIGESITNVASTDVKTQDELRKKKLPFQVYSEEKPSAGLSKKKKKETIYDKALKDLGGEEGVIKFFDKELKKKKKSGVVKKENVEVKNWLETIAEDNFHSMTSKSEIMELIKTKLNEVEVGPNVKKGHNGVPEFMSYDAISNTEVKESSPTTKPAPTKPKVDPGTKPKTPWSPKPGEKSKPKALKEKKNANK
jgi:hypothetical protein